MAVVLNKKPIDLFITEIGKRIPCNGKYYVIPDGIAEKYPQELWNIPPSMVEELEAKNKKLRHYEKVIHTLSTERKIYGDKFYDVKKVIEEKKEKYWDNHSSKFDMLFPFHFEGKSRQGALERLIASIKSIRNQKVNICVCNTSTECIYDAIKNLCNISYQHRPTFLETYNKPLTINLGVNLMITTPYFLLSDIDLIYPSTYVDEMKKQVSFKKPVRVVFNNYNLGRNFYSDNFNDYALFFKINPDISRTPFGIAPGNGLIHLKSFQKVRGYNTDYVGYGLEDAEFNFRIQYICKYKELNNEKVNTYHLFHDILLSTEIMDNNEKRFNKYRKFMEEKFKKKKFKEKKDLAEIVVNDENWMYP